MTYSAMDCQYKHPFCKDLLSSYYTDKACITLIVPVTG